MPIPSPFLRRLTPTLLLACALSACGGGSGGGVFSGLPASPDTPAPPAPPDTAIKPVMRCAP